jgi:hypothetical protein
MTRRRETMPAPPIPDMSMLMDAAGLRWYLAYHPVYRHMTDTQLGEKLNLSAGFVGMIRSGTRNPSRAFLDAIGWESVTLYRMKTSPDVTSKVQP